MTATIEDAPRRRWWQPPVPRAALVFIVVCLTAPLAVQGVVVTYAARAAHDAKVGARAAQLTASIADAATNPNCNPEIPACARANAARAAQGVIVPDLEEVSVVASYCGHVPANNTVAEVRACVLTEFQRLTGRRPQLAPTTTRRGGG